MKIPKFRKVHDLNLENIFWSIENSCEVLNKLKSRGFRASNLSTYDFSTLYTTLPHNLIKDKLVDLIEGTFQRKGSLYIACNDRNAFFTSDAVRNYNAALLFLFLGAVRCRVLLFIVILFINKYRNR